MRLIDEIDSDFVDAGAIAESWRQQPGSPGCCKDYDADGVRNPAHSPLLVSRQ